MTLELPNRAEIIARIRAVAPASTQILLFGSRARGDGRADSDVDLLLIVPDSSDTRAVNRQVRMALWGLGLGFDIVALRQADWAKMRTDDSWFARQVSADAIGLDGAA